jgi:Cu(I)/Ag(I) efflux system membrane fusion protein
MKSNLKTISLILGLFLVLASCQTKTPKVKDAKPVVEKAEQIHAKLSNIDTSFKAQINSVYMSYNQLKDALVADDSAVAITKANAVLADLNKVDMKLLKQPEAHKVWMTEKPLLVAQLNEVTSAKSLVAQRQAFLQISNSMIHLVENFGVSQKVMVQFCPMADDFKGGYWLSQDMAIKNPYFGHKMLTCGSTKLIIE